MADPSVGEVFADHRIEGVLGEGGMGIVYRARQITLDRPAALKLIKEAWANDADFRARFLREVRAAAAIEHPNVLQVYTAGEVDGRLFVSTPIIAGGDLHAAIAEHGPLPPAEAVDLIEQVAAGLDAAHAAGLIHRDVKAANVLVDEGGRAYLTDFGIARLRSAQTQLTAANQMVGTVDSIAPEQIEGKGVSERSDVYALGCLLFQMLTGRTVYADRPDMAAKLAAHVGAEPPSASAVVAGVPLPLDAVIATAMAKNPDDRYASAGALAAAAREAVGAPPTIVKTPAAATAAAPAATIVGTEPAAAAATPAPPSPPPSPPPAPERRIFGLSLPAAFGIAGGGIAAIVVVVLVLVLSGGGGGDSTTEAMASTEETSTTEATTTETLTERTAPDPAAVAALLARVPYTGCDETQPNDRALASVVCVPPGGQLDRVFIDAYDDSAGLLADYEAKVAAEFGTGVCPGTLPSSEGWTDGQGVERGRVNCLIDDDGTAVLRYTIDNRGFFIEAQRDDGDMVTAHDWWTDTQLLQN